MNFIRKLRKPSLWNLRPYPLFLGVSIPLLITLYYFTHFPLSISDSQGKYDITEVERLELMYKDDIKDSLLNPPGESETENATMDLKNTKNEYELNSVSFFVYENSSLVYSGSRPYLWRFKTNGSVSNFKTDNNLPLKVLIHDVRSSYKCSFPQELKDMYFNHNKKYSIIAVDWSHLASYYFPKDDGELSIYMNAVSNVGLVGRSVGNMISELLQHHVANSNQIHLIGFGLGAHIAGQAGEYLQKMNFSKIGRITGLDPSGLFFVTGKSSRHLQKDDAEFVDIVHTDMYRSGTFKSTGHTNFFINSGRDPQPGCEGYARAERKSKDEVDEYFGESCSHYLANVHYVQALVLDPQFMTAQKCDGLEYWETGLCRGQPTAVFGDGCNPRARGDYYLDMHAIIHFGQFICPLEPRMKA